MTERRVAALQVAAFPVLLAAGVLVIPVVADYSNDAAAARAAAETGRWVTGHLLSAVAFGAAILTSAALRSAAGTSFLATLLIACGAALHGAGLGADGIAPAALLAVGAPPHLFFRGSEQLIPLVFIAGAVVFGVGQLLQIIQFGRQLGPARRATALVAAATFSAAEAIPSGWGLYAVALAACVLYLPLAVALWRGRVGAAGVGER